MALRGIVAGRRKPMHLIVERLATPIGPILITHDGKVICNTEFEDSKERRAQELAQHFPDAIVVRAEKRSAFTGALKRYFDGDVRAIDGLPIANVGTPFQQRAWKELRKIPPGKTRGYGEQAARLGNARAARAVGRANGQNPNAIIVPCHRLVGADGSLVHYGGGLERKRWLIDHEARHADRRS
jgi:methylated-DNA-[protein]-cysteine S-methyltransferase